MVKWVPAKGWVLDIDKEATRKAYEQLAPPWPSCTCLYCQNFVAASRLLPEEFIRFCAGAGIDPAKPIEVYELAAGTNEGTRLYGGWYHLVGQILSSPDVGSTSDSGEILVGGFQVRFTDTLSLVPEGFHRPILQMDFYGEMPWVVEDNREPR